MYRCLLALYKGSLSTCTPSEEPAPALLGLFSLVTLFAHQGSAGGGRPAATDDLVPQETSDFADVLALVRKELWAQEQQTFLWVAFSDRHGQSPTGLCGTYDQRGLLRGVNGKSRGLRSLFSETRHLRSGTICYGQSSQQT